MIFTTNKALKAWGRVLHDEDLGQAIIDRVLECGRLIRLDGPSIRTLHLKVDEALKDDSDQEDEVAEFPEPTIGASADRGASSSDSTMSCGEWRKAFDSARQGGYAVATASERPSRCGIFITRLIQ
jgi:hypothetical protein